VLDISAQLVLISAQQTPQNDIDLLCGMFRASNDESKANCGIYAHTP
jgi:hypothetical protein